MNPSQHLARLVVPLDTSATAEAALHWGALMARDRAMDSSSSRAKGQYHRSRIESPSEQGPSAAASGAPDSPSP